MKKSIFTILSITILILAWQLLTMLVRLPELVPSIPHLFSTLVALFASGSFYQSVMATVLRGTIGMSITLGIPPLKYLIKKRISLAKKLLAETDEPIGDVAKACGYVDVAYFCRVFKNVEGVTPLAYRRLNCGNAPENPSERKD